MDDLRFVLRWFFVAALGIMAAYVALVVLGTVASYGLQAVRQMLR